MRARMLPFIAMLAVSAASAQEWQSVVGYGAAQTDAKWSDRAYALAATPDGGSVIAGTFNQTLDIEAMSAIAQGVQDMFVAKLDAGGKGVWLVHGGSKSPVPGYASAQAIAVDQEGHVFVSGYFSGRAGFRGSTSFPILALVSKGSRDVFLAKYDSDGQLLWVRRAGGAGIDMALGIAVDAAGNPHVTGYIGQGAADFSETTWLHGTAPVYEQTYFVAKYAGANGALMWARQGAQGEFAAHSTGAAIAIDPAGNAHVAGHFSRKLALSPNVMLDSAEPGDENVDAFLAKYAPTGELLWARQSVQLDAEQGGTEVYQAIEVDADSSIYVGGYIQSAVTLGDLYLSPTTSSDMVLAKYDAAGKAIWAHSTPSAVPRDLSLDPTGNVLVAGCFVDATYLPAQDDPIELIQPGEHVFAAGLAAGTGFGLWGLASAGDDHVFPHEDCAQGIAAQPDGKSVHVAGYFHKSAVFGEPTIFAKTQGHSTADIFVARIIE